MAARARAAIFASHSHDGATAPDALAWSSDRRLTRSTGHVQREGLLRHRELHHPSQAGGLVEGHDELQAAEAFGGVQAGRGPGGQCPQKILVRALPLQIPVHHIVPE